MADIRKIDETIAVAPQLAPQDIAEIAAAGYKSIICNRPDGEEVPQPAHKLVEAAAAEAGIEFYYQPVVSGAMKQQDVDDFSALVEQAPAPVLAYCRTGTRCAALWSVSQRQKGTEAASILQKTSSAGYDMSGLVR